MGLLDTSGLRNICKAVVKVTQLENRGAEICC